MDTTNPKGTVYTLITVRILALLEQGIIPWQQSWTGMPRSFVTNRPYRGINVWLLGALRYQDNRFLSWEEIRRLGGWVRKGEHGHMLVAVTNRKPHTQQLEFALPDTFMGTLQYSIVFNVTQTDLPADSEKDIVLSPKEIIDAMPNCPPIKSGRYARYDPIKDCITMPGMKRFADSNSYYRALFYALIRSTYHSSRANRPPMFVDDCEYSMETLICLLGQCYLCNCTGIMPPEGTSTETVLNGWKEKLRTDQRFIVAAASYAQMAIDYIFSMSTQLAPMAVQTAATLNPAPIR